MANYDWFSPSPAEMARSVRLAERRREIENAFAKRGYKAVIEFESASIRKPVEQLEFSVLNIFCTRCGCLIQPGYDVQHDAVHKVKLSDLL